MGDRVRTGAGASAKLRLADGTEVDLRADSEFRVAGLEGRIEEDGGGLTGLFMDLLRGGLRMVTGTVADSASDRFRLRTPVATIGVRGTEFEARVCRRGQACPGAEESDTEPREPAARLLKLRGVVEATGTNGATRVVAAGDGVYEGDTVETAGNAWAVLQFADDSKVSLQPGTRFRVDEWEFERDDADDGNALLNLLRGGMRVLTGLIGDSAGENYRVSTPVATIGVRGTGFDLVCVGSCINPDAVLGAIEGDGLFISTWDGTAFAELEGAIAEFAAGETGFIANRVLPAVRLQSLPPALQNLTAPRPDQVLGQLPDGIDRLYTQVEDGTITVQGATGDALAVGAGSAAAVAAGGAATPITPVAGATGIGTATLGAAFTALIAQQFDVVTLYGGASTGRAGVDSDDAFEDRIQEDFPGASVTSLSNAGIGTRAFGGVRVLEVLGFEVGYVDLGEFNSRIDPGSEDEAAVAEDALDKHPIAATGLDFSALVRTPVNINTWAFARAGVFVWEADVSTTTPSGETFSRSVDGTDPIVGGGVEHKIGPGLWARAEWIHYRLDPDQINFVGGGLVWTF
ncbi:MAG: FecR domain-containing protein [Halofilum sp. (in: g-proteobacteria)]|nr:FecR domain-containing protein [Halofilum sp. (in: g-proteobacteria)]